MLCQNQNDLDRLSSFTAACIRAHNWPLFGCYLTTSFPYSSFECDYQNAFRDLVSNFSSINGISVLFGI